MKKDRREKGYAHENKMGTGKGRNQRRAEGFEQKESHTHCVVLNVHAFTTQAIHRPISSATAFR